MQSNSNSDSHLANVKPYLFLFSSCTLSSNKSSIYTSANMPKVQFDKPVHSKSTHPNFYQVKPS